MCPKTPRKKKRRNINIQVRHWLSKREKQHYLISQLQLQVWLNNVGSTSKNNVRAFSIIILFVLSTTPFCCCVYRTVFWCFIPTDYIEFKNFLEQNSSPFTDRKIISSYQLRFQPSLCIRTKITKQSLLFFKKKTCVCRL